MQKLLFIIDLTQKSKTAAKMADLKVTKTRHWDGNIEIRFLDLLGITKM